MIPYYSDSLVTLYHGDCREILPQLDVKADLCLTDPPYNIGKAEWDRVKSYADWLADSLGMASTLLQQSGTLWFFHMTFSDLAALDVMLREKTHLQHKQLIILNKGLQSIAGRTSEDLRSYPRATEYLQFYTFSDPTGAQRLADKYAAVNPMAAYLRDEFNRAGIKNGEIQKLFPSKTGGLTGCVSNWLLGLNFPTVEQYETMRGRLGVGYLRREYEDLRREYEDLRYTFNLEQGQTDVWYMNSYQQENNGHETQKPISVISRIIRTASNEADLILDPFLGSGTTAVAAKMLKRKCIGIEISEKYLEIAANRLNRPIPLFDKPEQLSLDVRQK